MVVGLLLLLFLFCLFLPPSRQHFREVSPTIITTSVWTGGGRGGRGGVLAVAQKQMSCFFQIYQHINVLGLQWITFSFALSLLCSTVNENSRENVL